MALKSGESHAGFNWAAALFGSNWCFWRKLYGLAFTILVAELVTTLLLAAIVVEASSETPDLATVSTAGWIALLPVRLLLGRYANTLYLSRAIQAVAEARSEIADSARQQEYMAERGGTSWLVLGIALAVQVALTLARATPV